MLKSHQIQEKRSALLTAGKALETKAKAEKRDVLNAEESAELDRIAGEIETLNREERSARIFEEAERRAEAEPITSRGGDSLAEIERRFCVGKAIAEHVEGRLTGAEAEWNAERRSGRANALSVPVSVFFGERRAQLVGTPTAGGDLVSTQLGALVDSNRPLLAVESMGATVLSGLTSFLDIPKLSASGSVGWVAENTNATGSDAVFDKISMNPKTVTGKYEMSRRMLLQATQIETILRNDLGWLLRQALDSAAIQGGGANQPTGILAASGTNVVALGTNGAAITVDTAADMIGAVDGVDGAAARGFLTNTKIKKAAAKLKDAQSNMYSLSEIFRDEPVTFSNQVPSNLTKGTGTALSAILYGVWSDLIIGYWSAVDILANPYADAVASKGSMLLHAFLDADVGLRHPENFAVVKDAIAA